MTDSKQQPTVLEQLKSQDHTAQDLLEEIKFSYEVKQDFIQTFAQHKERK